MAMTVRRLTLAPGLGLVILAGHAGAGNPIEWAHSTELARPSPWLSGGELVMTTGLGVGTNDYDQFAYVSALVSAGASGLAFDTGTTFDRVPEGILAAGNALAFPIISVPPSTPFIAITRAVIDDLTNDQVRDVQRVVDRQESLARATVRGGITTLISALGRLLSSTVVLVGSDLDVLAADGANTDNATKVVQVFGESARDASARRGQVSKVVVDDNGYFTLQTVSAGPRTQAYLVVGSPSLLTPSERLLVAHAISMVSIELGKPTKVVDAEQRLRACVTRALLTLGELLDESLLRHFGFGSETTAAAVVLSNVGPLLEAERQTTAYLGQRNIAFLCAATDDGLLLVLTADRAGDTAAALREHLSRQLQREVASGIGSSTKVSDIASSARQATIVAHLTTPGESIYFTELTGVGFLLGQRSMADLRAWEQSLLGVLDTDATRASGVNNLICTLASFLDHNGEREAAAAALGVHRHTLRNRLNKITQLTGKNLDTASVRAELWLAIKARKMVEAQSISR
ncbi:PucR family transcriptional regulator ligand-binding domain-containing protein [Rhodococcus erythropolis]|nr:PucR family transcriptional regulator ligand-binding domain-containing protein [Rhodococcus erythropolis]